MATLDNAEALLEELRKASYDSAVQDLADVQAYAARQGVEYELKHWDVGYWAERLKEEKYTLQDEQLRPYFALPNVLKGLFQVLPLLCRHLIVNMSSGQKLSLAKGIPSIIHWNRSPKCFL